MGFSLGVGIVVNLDFGLDPVFSWYVVLLCISGVVMVGMAAVKSADQSPGSRALSVLAGLAFLGYGIYLGFIFDGGSYMMFFQAFILPALLVVNFIRSVVAKPTPPQPYQGAHAQQYQTIPQQQPYPNTPPQPSPYGQAQPTAATHAGEPTQPYPGQPYPGQPQPGPGSSQLN
ncbi:hypothetical protein GCM10009554_35760 [Kribbella koreensis]|uniref:Uncharacterized protein n=1 Tax=Kribbella koreensis TaxID=57909 RepID=A0ABP4B2R9_9ACTN